MNPWFILMRTMAGSHEPGVSGNMPIVANPFKGCMFTDVGHTPNYPWPLKIILDFH